MDSNVAETAARVFTELLNSNEQRYTSQISVQTSHEKQLHDLQHKLESLEARCIQLENNNVNLKTALDTTNKNFEHSKSTIVQLQSDNANFKITLETVNKNLEDSKSKFVLLENVSAKLKSTLEEFSKWFQDAILKVSHETKLNSEASEHLTKKVDSYVQVLSKLVEEINDLKAHRDGLQEYRVDLDQRVNQVERTQGSVIDTIKRQGKQLTDAIGRLNAVGAYQRHQIPKSPSASAFIHSSSPNTLPKSHHSNRMDNFDESGSFDPASDFGELSDCADELKSRIDEINRSGYGPGSYYSEVQSNFLN